MKNLSNLVNISVSFFTLMFWLVYAPPAISADQDTALWKSLQTGDSIALLRHAIAPGTGDPPVFKLDRCETQRNLSSEGRDQAMRIGLRFRENGMQTVEIFSSQWCRCLDTAKLLELGPVQDLSILNSFFRKHDQREPRTQALKKWIATKNSAKPVILVTHQVNITALTGIYPSSGEMVIIRRSDNEKVEVVGTIKTD